MFSPNVTIYIHIAASQVQYMALYKKIKKKLPHDTYSLKHETANGGEMGRRSVIQNTIEWNRIAKIRSKLQLK